MIPHTCRPAHPQPRLHVCASSCASCWFFIVRLHEFGMTCGTGLENMMTSSAQAMRRNSMAGVLYYVTMVSLQDITWNRIHLSIKQISPISNIQSTIYSLIVHLQAQIIFPLSSLPPRSLLLTPSFDTVFPTPSPSPPWPSWPPMVLLMPSWSLFTGSTPVTLVCSSCSGRDALVEFGWVWKVWKGGVVVLVGACLRVGETGCDGTAGVHERGTGSEARPAHAVTLSLSPRLPTIFLNASHLPRLASPNSTAYNHPQPIPVPIPEVY